MIMVIDKKNKTVDFQMPFVERGRRFDDHSLDLNPQIADHRKSANHCSNADNNS